MESVTDSSSPISRGELRRRRAAFDRFRLLAGAIGAAPLLCVYVLVHTRVLQEFLPDSKHLSAVILICVPLGWMFGVARAYEWWGVRHFGLQCPGCGGKLVGEGLRQAPDRTACRGCGMEFTG